MRLRETFRHLVLLLSLLLPVLAQAAGEEELAKLRQGTVLSEGGYEGRAIWARMVGVIEAPPRIVWDLFVNSDDWRGYRIPTLIDSRLVSAEIARLVEKERGVKRFYEVLGDRAFPLALRRPSGGRWVHHAFQYYNVPWPVANRWMVVRTEDDETRAAAGIYRAGMKYVAGNLKTFEGSIEIVPFEGNPAVSKLTYWAKTDPGAHVPRFLMKWGVKRVMPAVIRALRHEAVRRRGISPSSSGSSWRPPAESRP